MTRPWLVREQIIQDQHTGLTLRFSVDRSGERRLTLLSNDLPFGNLEFQFDTEGRSIGSSTLLDGSHARLAVAAEG
jgi:hypothetical protein